MPKLDFTNIRSQQEIESIVDGLREYDPSRHVINAKTLKVEKKGGHLARFWRSLRGSENFEVDKVAQSIILLQSASTRSLKDEQGIKRFYEHVDQESRTSPSHHPIDLPDTDTRLGMTQYDSDSGISGVSERDSSIRSGSRSGSRSSESSGGSTFQLTPRKHFEDKATIAFNNIFKYYLLHEDQVLDPSEAPSKRHYDAVREFYNTCHAKIESASTIDDLIINHFNEAFLHLEGNDESGLRESVDDIKVYEGILRNEDFKFRRDNSFLEIFREEACKRYAKKHGETLEAVKREPFANERKEGMNIVITEMTAEIANIVKYRRGYTNAKPHVEGPVFGSSDYADAAFSFGRHCTDEYLDKHKSSHQPPQPTPYPKSELK